MGISDGKQFLKKRYTERTDVIYLSSCCVSDVIIDQLDAAVEEACTNDSWVDVKTMCPSPLTNEDVNQLLSKCVKGRSLLFCWVLGNLLVSDVGKHNIFYTKDCLVGLHKLERNQSCLLKVDYASLNCSSILVCEKRIVDQRQKYRGF